LKALQRFVQLATRVAFARIETSKSQDCWQFNPRASVQTKVGEPKILRMRKLRHGQNKGESKYAANFGKVLCKATQP
jgi:hypothetical protein